MLNSTEYSRIRISRDKYIEESRGVALVKLNEHEFLKGELVMINYYKEPDLKSNIGTLVVIGIGDGVGEQYYRMLNVGGTVTVRNVVTSIPDVSALVHDELYIYYNSDTGLWYYVYKNAGDTERSVDVIPDGQFIFVDIESGYRWFYNNQVCRREDDFFSREEIASVLNSINNQDSYLEVTSDSGTIFKVGEVRDITLSIHNFKTNGVDVSWKCKYYLNEKQIVLDENGKYTIPSVNLTTKFQVKSDYEIAPGLYITYAKDIYIRFGYYFYYGIVPSDWKVTVNNVSALSKKELHYKENIYYEGITLNLEKLAFAYPQTYGKLEHIFDVHGIDYIYDYTLYSDGIVLDGVKYYVYLKMEPVLIRDFKQKYLFYTQDSVVSGASNTSESALNQDMYEAWRNKNSGSGFLVLDSSGKIPSNVLDGASSIGGGSGTSNLVFIERIQTEAPYRAEAGQSFYVESENKIYTATTETEFSITDPSYSVLYINRANHSQYYWTGTTLSALGSIGSQVISDITEIL